MHNLAQEINADIKNSNVYKRYLSCKELVENNEELKDLQCQMKLLKDKNCKQRDESLIDDYYILEKRYKSNVLVKEYEKSKNEVYELLKEISDILSFK